MRPRIRVLQALTAALLAIAAWSSTGVAAEDPGRVELAQVEQANLGEPIRSEALDAVRVRLLDRLGDARREEVLGVDREGMDQLRWA